MSVRVGDSGVARMPVNACTFSRACREMKNVTRRNDYHRLPPPPSPRCMYPTLTLPSWCWRRLACLVSSHDIIRPHLTASGYMTPHHITSFRTPSRGIVYHADCMYHVGSDRIASRRIASHHIAPLRVSSRTSGSNQPAPASSRV